MESVVQFLLSEVDKKNFTVLDIGAGYCEFINNIQCAQKYAIDLNGKEMFILAREPCLTY